MLNQSRFQWSKRWRGGSGISWTICKSSAPHSRHITMPVPRHSVFLQVGCPYCCPANSIKALKAHWHKKTESNLQVGNIWVMTTVWRIRQKIIKIVQCCIGKEALNWCLSSVPYCVLQLRTLTCTHSWAVLTDNCFYRFRFAYCMFFLSFFVNAISLLCWCFCLVFQY